MKSKIRIVTLVENSTLRSDILVEHGLSLWIEYGDKRIIFDTGQSNIILENAKTLGIDLSCADAIVLSHGHYDHCGGLAAVLEVACKAKIYAHPDVSLTRFSKKSFGTRYVGMSDEAKSSIHTRDVIWTRDPLEIFKGFWVTGSISRKNNFEDTGGNFFVDKQSKIKDEISDDQAIFIESRSGIVVLLGCAHSGVVNILQQISAMVGRKKSYRYWRYAFSKCRYGSY